MSAHKVDNSFISKLTNFLKSNESVWFGSDYLAEKFNVKFYKISNSICVIRKEDSRFKVHAGFRHSKYCFEDEGAAAREIIRGKWLCN